VPTELCDLRQLALPLWASVVSFGFHGLSEPSDLCHSAEDLIKPLLIYLEITFPQCSLEPGEEGKQYSRHSQREAVSWTGQIKIMCFPSQRVPGDFAQPPLCS
jgi:hypothetical protein